MTENGKFAPREVFDQILEYMPIPTFDIVVEYGEQGIILVRRKIAPYKDVWALPGLRMYKGEDIDGTLQRIAEKELGLAIDTSNKVLLGQFVGKFKTEHDRQDISTGYLIKVKDDQEITINQEHFYAHRVTREIPENTGAMYRYYLRDYQRLALPR